MGFFDWLAKTAIKSNEKYFDSLDRDRNRSAAQRQAQERYNNSVECCANCFWFEAYSCGRLNCCVKHDYSFDDKAIYNHVCIDFKRK